jgi:hypothetical protein
MSGCTQSTQQDTQKTSRRAGAATKGSRSNELDVDPEE